MIAKLQSISYTQNALNYCEKGGELIYCHNCLGDANQIYQQMSIQNLMNDKCEKQTFHIKLRIAPDDKDKLTTQDWIDISNKYSVKIGFNSNLFSVYMHDEGTEKEHVHIIATRITDDNLAVTDSFTHFKNLDFCREIEEEYNLRRIKRKLEAHKKGEIFKHSDKRIQILKEKIFRAIAISNSIEDVTLQLKKVGIKMKVGRGVSFTDEDGFHVKGSKIDRKLSLTGIKNLFVVEPVKKNRFKMKF